MENTGRIKTIVIIILIGLLIYYASTLSYDQNDMVQEELELKIMCTKIDAILKEISIVQSDIKKIDEELKSILSEFKMENDSKNLTEIKTTNANSDISTDSKIHNGTK